MISLSTPRLSIFVYLFILLYTYLTMYYTRYYDKRDAEDAMDALNGRTYDGRDLRNVQSIFKLQINHSFLIFT